MQRHDQGKSATALRGGSRWSADEAQAILDEWAASGESLQGFARQRGLVPQRLWWWRNRLAGKRRGRVAAVGTVVAAPAFLPVTVRPVEPESQPVPEAKPVLLTVETAGGVRVSVRALDGASAAWVAQLLNALGAAS